MSRTRASLAAAVLLALALGACTDDDPDPRSSPSPSPSPSEPASPSASATAEDEASFVRSYFDAISRAMRTGDTSDLVAVTAAGCENCRILVANIKRAFADGGHVEGASWVITAIEPDGRQLGGSVWNVDVKTARERWLDRSGQLVKVVRPSSQQFAVIVATAGDRAEMKDLRLRS